MGDSALTNRIEPALSITFLLFAAGCTFSIAVAQIFLGLSIVLFGLLFFFKGKKLLANQPREIYLILGLMIVWALLSALIRSDFKSGLRDLEWYWTMLGLPVGWYLLQSEKYRNRVVKLVAVLILLGGFAGILQFFTGVKWPGVDAPMPSNGWGYRAQGFFSSRMTFAQVFAPFVLFLFYLGCADLRDHKRTGFTRVYLLAGLLGAIGVLLALSRSAMAALVLGMLTTGFLLGRRVLGLIFVGLLVGGVIAWVAVPDFALRIENTSLIDLRDYKVAGRQFIWDRSFEILKDHPLIGVGRSGFHDEYVARLPEDFNDDRIPGDAHSDWLQMAVTGGIPALILFAVLWILIVKRAVGQTKSSLPVEQNLARAGLVAIFGILVMSIPVSLFEDREVVHAIVLIWLLTLVPLGRKEQG